MTKVSFDAKFLFALNVAKNGPKKEVILSFHKMLWLVFPRSNLKWKTLQSLFSCANLISDSQAIDQNALVEPDCGILWSSIYLEEMPNFLGFFVWRYPLGKVACETATFGWACSDVLTNLQVFTSSNLYRVSKSLFG